MTIAELFESRKDDPRWNTSYPLNPKDWAGYRVDGPLPFDKDQRLSFYIHIPFCKQLCSFCEYTRMLCPDDGLQETYLRVVANDIDCFKKQYKGLTLLGCDIGGGTPTSLTEKNFSLLMEFYKNAVSGLDLSEDFEPSIEGTFNTLSGKKLNDIAKAGFKRLSLGVQSSSHSIMESLRRLVSDEKQMKEWLSKASQAGIKKVNLDFMYGLQGQNEAFIQRDLELIDHLRPQQVTLYELRTNMLSIQTSYTKEELFSQYTQYYEGLISMGYLARFGQNTFSVDAEDLGVSSYLRERMLNGASYKGFGLSAQSMSSAGVSYNLGKLSGDPSRKMNAEGYQEEYTYLLPAKELAAKYMAISAYHGSFSTKKLLEIGIDEKTLNNKLDYCFSQGLLTKGNDDKVYVTRKGFEHYGAVFSLFY
ncbi:MAG: radical SAM protein [Bacteroidales bacterium]|nr:radical SAM protein [Bacteroidales bacterium]